MPQIPYRPYQNPQADLGLPFDPNQGPIPLSPEEWQNRQPLLNASQSLQDALGQQNQAMQGPSGVAGILSNPIFQAAVPTALTALSAIFPRHMAIAAPIGMAGFRTVEDLNQQQQRQQQTQASENVSQRMQDFLRQKYGYTVGNAGFDPQKTAALKLEGDINLKDAPSKLSVALQNQAKDDAFNQAKGIDPSTLSPDTELSVTNSLGQTYRATGHKTKELTGEIGNMSLLFPQQPGESKADWATRLAGEADKLRTPTPAEKAEKDYIDKHGGDHLSYVAAVSRANEAGPLSLHATEEAQKREKREKLYEALGRGEFPMVSMARSIDTAADMADIAAERKAKGLPVYNLTARLAEQTAYMSRLKDLESGTKGKIIDAAQTMTPTLTNLTKKYDKIAPLLTQYPIVNDALLDHVYKNTGNKDVIAFKTALAETRNRLELFVNNGFAPTQSTAKGAYDMLSGGFPPDAFHEAVDVTRDNAKDIVQAIVGMQLYGVDPNAPILQNAPIGPRAPEVHLAGEGATSGGQPSPVGTIVVGADGKKQIKTSQGWKPYGK